MKIKSKIFDLSAISIIACDCLQAVISIFVDIFFISKIFQMELPMSQKIINIGVYYIILYSLLALSYAFSGFALKKINKSIFVSIGAGVLTVAVLMIYLFDKSGILATFVPLIAVVYGTGWAFFSAGYNNLTAETISSKHQVKFFAVKKLMFQLTYVIFPVTLGLVIDNVDFSVMALIMLVICAFLILFSFLIKPKKTYKLSFNLPQFAKKLKENKKECKPLFYVYLSNFFRGASYDCFTTLITILVVSTFSGQVDTKLGMFQSIFTAASLITMIFYLKFYRKKRATKFILPTVILVAATIVGIFFSSSEIAIICFYAVYVILNVILMSVSDSRRSGVVRVLSLHSHILESNAFGEFFLGGGRVLSSIVLLLAGVFDGLVGGGSVIFLKIAIAYVAVMYVMYGVSLIWLERSLIKQNEDFAKAHENETIEKNED